MEELHNKNARAASQTPNQSILGRFIVPNFTVKAFSFFH